MELKDTHILEKNNSKDDKTLPEEKNGDKFDYFPIDNNDPVSPIVNKLVMTDSSSDLSNPVSNNMVEDDMNSLGKSMSNKEPLDVVVKTLNHEPNSSDDSASSSYDSALSSYDSASSSNESTSDESDIESEDMKENKAINVKENDKVEKLPKIKDKLTLGDLPNVEPLDIFVDKTVKLAPLGTVKSVLNDDAIVIVKSLENVPAIDADSILFMENRSGFGRVFEIFGPVRCPHYCVRFNNMEEIKSTSVEIEQTLYYAPDSKDITHFVFLSQLRNMKGSDASWVDDQEPPSEFIEFSDDEIESMAKRNKKNKRKIWNQADLTDEGPTRLETGKQRYPEKLHMMQNTPKDTLCNAKLPPPLPQSNQRHFQSCKPKELPPPPLPLSNQRHFQSCKPKELPPPPLPLSNQHQIQSCEPKILPPPPLPLSNQHQIQSCEPKTLPPPPLPLSNQHQFHPCETKILPPPTLPLSNQHQFHPCESETGSLPHHMLYPKQLPRTSQSHMVMSEQQQNMKKEIRLNPPQVNEMAPTLRVPCYRHPGSSIDTRFSTKSTNFMMQYRTHHVVGQPENTKHGWNVHHSRSESPIDQQTFGTNFLSMQPNSGFRGVYPLHDRSPINQQCHSNNQWRMPPSHQQRMTSSHQQRIPSSHQQRMTSSHQQRMTSSHQQRIPSSHQQRMTSSHQQRMTSSHQQRMTLFNQQRMASPPQKRPPQSVMEYLDML